MTDEEKFLRAIGESVADDATAPFLKLLGEFARQGKLLEIADAMTYWQQVQRPKFPYAHAKIQAVLLNHFFLYQGFTADQLHSWNTAFDWNAIMRSVTSRAHFPVAVDMALESLRSHAANGPITIPGVAAYFEFVGKGVPDLFVIKLIEQAKIEHAREILRREETRKVHLMGTIIKEPVTYNPPWHYHLKPESIQFFEMAMEVCDASMAYVEDHLDEVGDATLPNEHWCPWDSMLTREIKI
jgi:hypothetical protein